VARVAQRTRSRSAARSSRMASRKRAWLAGSL
jgi:hypothetical protein